MSEQPSPYEHFLPFLFSELSNDWIWVGCGLAAFPG